MLYIYIFYIIIYIMAEGGFDNEDPWLDDKLDHDGDDARTMMMTKKKLTQHDHLNQALLPHHTIMANR